MRLRARTGCDGWTADVRRGFVVVLWAAMAVAALAAWQPWWDAGPTTVTGAAATSGAAPALILAALAGTFLSSWLDRTGARVVLAMVALVLAAAVPVAVMAQVPTGLPGLSLNEGDAIVPTVWRIVYVAAAALGAIAAVVVLVLRRPKRRNAADGPAHVDPWRALDRGEDPTADPGRGAGGEAPADQQQ